MKNRKAYEVRRKQKEATRHESRIELPANANSHPLIETRMAVPRFSVSSVLELIVPRGLDRLKNVVCRGVGLVAELREIQHHMLELGQFHSKRIDRRILLDEIERYFIDVAPGVFQRANFLNRSLTRPQ